MRNELVIGDDAPAGLVFPADYGRGLVPRDYATHPVGYCCPPMRSVNVPLIPRSEWPERIRDMEATQSRLSDIRLRGNGGQPIPSLDQGQVGYCWAHSTTHAVTLLRAVMGLLYVPLSAYAIAATIKRGRDEGGWGALSMEFVQQRGVPAQSLWPQGDRAYQKYAGQPAVWDNAKLHTVTEGWIDLDAAVYARSLTFDQVATLLLSRVPVVGDFNWWGHSVCLLDLVETSPGQFGVRILNSWGDSWSDRGMGVLSGSKAVPDSAVAPLVTRASAA